jgi:hypothetical protein
LLANFYYLDLGLKYFCIDYGSVPEIEHREYYFAHRIGDRILILSLDTGYARSMEGDQTIFLDEELKVSEIITSIVIVSRLSN